MAMPRGVMLMHHRTLAALHGQEVVYSRGSESWTVRAAFGRVPLQHSDDFGGPRLIWTIRNFLIAASDLPVEPRHGDRVHVQHDGVTDIYEVVSIDGEPEWRWSDHSEVIRRIHTKYIDTITP